MLIYSRALATATLSRRRTSWSVSPSPTDKPAAVAAAALFSCQLLHSPSPPRIRHFPLLSGQLSADFQTNVLCGFSSINTVGGFSLMLH